MPGSRLQSRDALSSEPDTDTLVIGADTTVDVVAVRGDTVAVAAGGTRRLPNRESGPAELTRGIPCRNTLGGIAPNGGEPEKWDSGHPSTGRARVRTTGTINCRSVGMHAPQHSPPSPGVGGWRDIRALSTAASISEVSSSRETVTSPPASGLVVVEPWSAIARKMDAVAHK